MTDGGEGVLGVLVSEEKRKKLSEASKGNTNFLGKTHSEETRQKISEAKKGNTNMLGKKLSEETRQKLSEAHKGKIPSEETRKKLSEASKGNTNMLGKKLSEETRQKISLGGRNRKNVKGYAFNKAIKKYQARIKIGRKQIYLGSFDTPEEASEAYQQAKLIYHV
jgi:hypothetical protein